MGKKRLVPVKTLPSITNPSQFELPSVSDKDICWVTSLLGLPSGAFQGEDGTDPRHHVLRSMEPMDITACPGSGKTTLLVAKLAILAKRWRYTTQGICVLSHTNAARREIETRLGTTNVGRQLLSYPHFIGTIHGFVNEFLALPWLRSKGIPIKMIDTDICLERRWKALPFNTRSALETNHHARSVLSIEDPECNLGDVRWGKGGVLGENTTTYRAMKGVCEQSISDGYFCYNEMFVWARELLDTIPEIAWIIRDRFPLLFFDEAQDNSEGQSTILHRIFRDGDAAVVRQRFGDANQAIYGSVGAAEASTDKFPDESIKTDIPNSYRFEQDIADLADPLGLTPYGMKGHGPKQMPLAKHPKGRHTVFLFDDDNADRVLHAYADLLIETFSSQELLTGVFTAVGQIHKPSDKDNPRPRHVGHYWSGYDPELSKSEPKPQTFVQYVFAGLGKLRNTGETYHLVEKIAEGILRLASMAKGVTALPRGRYNHRIVLKLFETQPDIQERYTGLVKHFVEHGDSLAEAAWKNGLRTSVHCIAAVIAGTPLDDPEALAFLEWRNEQVSPKLLTATQKSRDNVHRFSKNGKDVAVRIGSVHSVKGENHTATLVLETYWKDRKGRHNLELLLPWLNGENSGGKSVGKEQKERLKIHYVAMTRPSHLLCLAIKKTSFEDDAGNLDQGLLDRLKRRGWQVKLI